MCIYRQLQLEIIDWVQNRKTLERLKSQTISYIFDEKPRCLVIVVTSVTEVVQPLLLQF